MQTNGKWVPMPTAVAEQPPAVDLRARLLGELTNVELRQKYLATRTPAWAAADLRRAAACLLAGRLARGVIGLGLVGAAGAALGAVCWGTPAGAGAGNSFPVGVAIGCAVSGAISFGVLAACGFVVLAELVGEEKNRRPAQGVRAVVGEMIEVAAEAGCGVIWGAICGLVIGLLAGVVHGALRLPPTALTWIGAGAAGGVLLAVLFAIFVVAVSQGKGPSMAARFWAGLGPLPATAYLLSHRMARRRYLHKG